MANWIERLISPIFPWGEGNKYKPRNFGGSIFYPLQSSTYNSLVNLKVFHEVPELSAVINLKARAFSMGRIHVVNQDGEEIEGHWLEQKLRNPNWFQSGQEFMMQTKIFHELYGNEYLYSLTPFGFKKDRVKGLFVIPANLIKIQYLETKPYWNFPEMPEGVKYLLKDARQETELPKEQMIHLNDNKVTFKEVTGDKNVLLGESKLTNLQAPLNNIKMAYESRGIIIKYRGAQGIISPEAKDVAGSIPLEKDDKNVLKEAWQHYGTMEGQSQMAIVNNAVKFQSLTVNEPKKLGLFEETELDFQQILSAFGCRREQFPNTKGATFENQNQAEKAFYQDTAIPEANEWIAAVGKFYLGEDTKERLVIDFSHLPIFQEDLNERAKAVSKMTAALSVMLQDQTITIDEYKEELKKLGIGAGS